MSQTASTLQGQNPLDALAPNILPSPIGDWPPAIGWWVVAITALIILGLILLRLLLWYRKQAYRRQGRKQLQAIYEQFQQHNDRQRFLRESNYLLKAVALQAFPRKATASLSGLEWQRFLNKTLDKTGLSKTFTQGAGQALGTASYEKETSVDPESLHRAIDLWIRKHHA